MSLTEGKNREVRRVLAHLGLQVSRLIRTAYGPFTLEGLEPGEVDEVDRGELERVPQDAEVRIIAGEWRGRPIEAPPGHAHAPDRRPRARDPVLDARQPPRQLRGPARRRPVRRAAARWASRRCRAARRSATFVENDAKAAAIIKRNADKLGATIACRSSAARRWRCRAPSRST